MILIARVEPIFDRNLELSESVCDKVEAYDLKKALQPTMTLPFVDLNIEEYQTIKDKLVMSTISITVKNFYGIPSYYSVMPQDIFDALELAALKGDDTASVNKQAFDKMIADYNEKMKQ